MKALLIPSIILMLSGLIQNELIWIIIGGALGMMAYERIKRNRASNSNHSGLHNVD